MDMRTEKLEFSHKTPQKFTNNDIKTLALSIYIKYNIDLCLKKRR